MLNMYVASFFATPTYNKKQQQQQHRIQNTLRCCLHIKKKTQKQKLNSKKNFVFEWKYFFLIHASITLLILLLLVVVLLFNVVVFKLPYIYICIYFVFIQPNFVLFFFRSCNSLSFSCWLF